MQKKTSLLGTGWQFPPSFSRESGVHMAADEEDIRQSLHILLSTEVGERVMQPTYGCNMKRLVFEPLNTSLQTYMKHIINTAILYFEPRIILNNVHLEPVVNEGRIDITLDYTIATTNTRHNYVYPFYKQEGTELER